MDKRLKNKYYLSVCIAAVLIVIIFFLIAWQFIPKKIFPYFMLSVALLSIFADPFLEAVAEKIEKRIFKSENEGRNIKD